MHFQHVCISRVTLFKEIYKMMVELVWTEVIDYMKHILYMKRLLTSFCC